MESNIRNEEDNQAESVTVPKAEGGVDAGTIHWSSRKDCILVPIYGGRETATEDEEKPKVEKANKLLKTTCPVESCKKCIVDLRRHLIDVHKWEKSKAKLAKLNFGLRKSRSDRQGKIVNRDHVRRICPVESCGKIVARLENHLKQFHKIVDKVNYKALLKSAQSVSDDFDFFEHLGVAGHECPQRNISVSSDDENIDQEKHNLKPSKIERSFPSKHHLLEPSIFAEKSASDSDTEEDTDYVDGDSDTSNDEAGITSAEGSDLQDLNKEWCLQFENWIMSPDGGHKQQKDARHHSVQISTIISYLGIFTRLFDKYHLWKDWLKVFEQKRRPGTIKSYLHSLVLFYKFVIAEIPSYVTTSLDDVLRLREVVQEWARSYMKKCQRRKWEKEMEDRPKLIQKDDMLKLDQSSEVREATKIFGRLSYSTFTLTKAEYTLARDFLITSLCLDNATRSGAIAHMTVHEVEKAMKEGNSMVIYVLKHKTLATSGPAAICTTLSTYRYLSLFSTKARRSIVVNPQSRDLVFLTWNGASMSSSNVTQQFNSFWTKAVGKTETRSRINASLVRKSCVTAVHKDHPEMKTDLANLMNHSVKTAENVYFLQNKLEKAAKTSQRLRSIMRGTSGTDVSEDEDIIQSLFQSELKENTVTLEIVKRKMLSEQRLNDRNPKKVYDHLRYLMKKQQSSGEPPEEEETEEEKMERFGLETKKDSEIQEDTAVVADDTDATDPFTEAGSSICCSRVSYTASENQAIEKAFRHMVESDCVIKGSEVMNIFRTRKELKSIHERHQAHQLIDKIRTARKAYQRRNSLRR